jgi:fatty-acyl-CoA synthase
MTAGPPSSVVAALRTVGRADAEHHALDLSSIRWLHLGAERTDPLAVDEIVERAGRMGLRRTAIGTGYGMAEATLGLTGTVPGTGQRFDHVDAGALAHGFAEPAPPGGAQRVTSCGPPLPSVVLRIVDDGRVVPDRTVGEVQARGPSMMRGYLTGNTGRPVEQPFEDGWLRTGDMGYLADGELFVVGRVKDLIIARGRNIAPEDAEWAAARVDGVRVGRVVAFAPSEASEGTMVIAFEATRGADPIGVRDRVRDAVTDAVELVPAAVLLVEEGTIPKTTSGKLRRSEVRERYERGELVDRTCA